MPPKVLLVDDEPHVVEAFKRSMRKERFQIRSAQSAAQALQLLDQEPVDVVISDEKMPGMSGSQLLAAIAVRFPDTIRIMLTGHASLELAMKAINEGQIYRFMIKPVSEPELALTIRQALEHRQLLRQVASLKETVHKQSMMLKDLESRYPGISELQTDSSGRIILDFD